MCDGECEASHAQTITVALLPYIYTYIYGLYLGLLLFWFSDVPLCYIRNCWEKYPRKYLIRTTQSSLFSIYELPMRIIASLWLADLIHSFHSNTNSKYLYLFPLMLFDDDSFAWHLLISCPILIRIRIRRQILFVFGKNQRQNEAHSLPRAELSTQLCL